MKKHLIPVIAVMTAILASFLTGIFFGRKLSSTPIEISAPVSNGPSSIVLPAEDVLPQVAEISYPIDINKAGIYELMSLPGIGEVLAKRIIAYRETFGPFSLPEEIMDVEGISQKKYDAIKDLICIGG